MQFFFILLISLCNADTYINMYYKRIRNLYGATPSGDPSEIITFTLRNNKDKTSDGQWRCKNIDIPFQSFLSHECEYFSLFEYSLYIICQDNYMNTN